APAARAVRPKPAGRPIMSARPRLLGLPGALLLFAVLAALPFVFSAHWFVNLAVFTLIYAGLATAWNLVGGFAGYPSLGHAAFFGIGAYVEALWFAHHSLGGGYAPFVLLPLIALATAGVSLPVAWIAMRTRADVV